MRRTVTMLAPVLLSIMLHASAATGPVLTCDAGERGFLDTRFTSDSCCSNWVIPDTFDLSSGELVPGDGEWSAVTLAGNPAQARLNLQPGSLSLCWTLRRIADTKPETGKVIIELNIDEHGKEPRHVKFAIRPSIRRFNPENEYYQLSMDPGWQRRHEKDVFLNVPDGQFAVVGRSEHFRITLSEVSPNRILVMAYFWDPVSGWREFSAKRRKRLTSPDWAEAGQLPLVLSVDDNLVGRAGFQSINVRFRTGGRMALRRFAIARLQTGDGEPRAEGHE